MNEGIPLVQINFVDAIPVTGKQAKSDQLDQTKESPRIETLSPDELVLSPYAQYLRQIGTPESPNDINRQDLGLPRLVYIINFSA